MDKLSRILLAAVTLVLAAACAGAVSCARGVGAGWSTEMLDTVMGLEWVAGALAVFLIGIQGLRWFTADNPQEREEARDGLTYVLLGVVVVALAHELVRGLYCQTIAIY